MVLKLNLPENILGKEQYAALSTYQKGEYVTNLLKQIVELNPQGVTISQIDKAIKLGHSTIWHHLEKLADSAFCLKMERGDTAVYNFNKVLDELEDCHIQGKFYHYDFDLIENIFGKFVRIQTKQEDQSGNLIVHSGVIIGTTSYDKVVDSIVKIRDVHLNADKNKEFFGDVAKPEPKDSSLDEGKD
ncbi:hypothetical protein HYT53_05645 [Candidatus Woesearchaeota archaeon]|nr:hypothetical protein [Candidatus Woesearchaeota archaeon]